MHQIFILYCEEQRRIAVIIAANEDTAFRSLAKAECPDENPADLMDHYKKHWRVLATRNSGVTGAFLVVTHDADEGYEIFRLEKEGPR